MCRRDCFSHPVLLDVRSKYHVIPVIAASFEIRKPVFQVVFHLFRWCGDRHLRVKDEVHIVDQHRHTADMVAVCMRDQDIDILICFEVFLF